MIRPLILDLLPSTHGEVIYAVTCWDGNNPYSYRAARPGEDGIWRVYNGNGQGTGPVDPADITEFTVHAGPDTTTYTEGADTNEWTAIIRREQT